MPKENRQLVEYQPDFMNVGFQVRSVGDRSQHASWHDMWEAVSVEYYMCVLPHGVTGLTRENSERRCLRFSADRMLGDVCEHQISWSEWKGVTLVIF